LAGFIVVNIACASSPATKVATAQLELVSLSPPVDQLLDPAAILVATLQYSISEFLPDTYLIVPQFNATTAGTTHSGADEEWEVLRTAAGMATVSFPLAEVLQSPRVVKPLRMRFYLLRRLGDGRSNIVARTEPLNLKVAGK